MTQMAGPADTLNYQYDAMSRLVGMTDFNNATVATANYDSNTGMLSQVNWGGFSETRTYNSLQQLTRMMTENSGSTIMDMEYDYAHGAHNGRVTQIIDRVSMDTQAFTYDSLNRLTGVTSSIGNNESFTYDGFGNLTSMGFGNQSPATYTYDGTTNRRTDFQYDANGNVTQGQPGYSWDIENRMTNNFAAYDPLGKRVKVNINGQDQWFFYSITGQRVGTFVVNPDGSMDVATDPQTLKREVNRYFGGKLIQSNGLLVATDRLGSVRANSNGDQMRYKAYGGELTSTANGREKFGTYYRDGVGLDYADQRYYGPGSGRFMTPDPSTDNVDYADPGSWNAYAYANGDPINFNDPDGTTACGDLTNGATRTS